MFVRVNSASGLPLYLQVESQIKHAVAAGALKQGDALPSVRKMASDLRINPNTVARAYQDLERDGLIRTVPGGGTYVADHVPGLLKTEKMKRLRPYAMQLAVEGTHLRLSPDEIVKLVEDSLDELGVKP
jgi:GntR family transcriptional regulator